MTKQFIKLLGLIVTIALSFPATAQNSNVPAANAPALTSPDNNRVIREIGVGLQGRPQTNDQFTSADYDFIAKNYSMVFIEKFHGKFDLQKQREAAVELKKRNPNIKVFPYLSVKINFNQYRPIPADKESWYLHDQNGDKIPFSSTNARGEKFQSGWLIDNANPEYRNWVVNTVVRGLMNDTENGRFVWDGIHFDNANYFSTSCVGDGGCGHARQLLRLIGADGVRRQNEGVKSLLRETKAATGERLVIFNGVEDSGSYVNKSLEFLTVADGAANERFGYYTNGFIDSRELLGYINMMYEYPSKIFIQKTNVLPKHNASLDNGGLKQIARYAFGSFLLGCQPGTTYYKFGMGYGYDREIGVDPDEVTMAFGGPVDRYSQDNGAYPSKAVFLRTFQNGLVYVNMENAPASVTLPSRVVLVNGGVAGKVYQPGEAHVIPAHDAAFFLSVK